MLMIDPPVGPYHAVKEIRAWIGELERLREEQPAHVEEIDQAIKEAERWLELKGEAPRR